MQIIMLSILAGVCGTGIGGLVGVLFSGSSADSPSLFLSFAGGVMISIVSFGLVPEAISTGNAVITVIGLIIGVVVIMILNKGIDFAMTKSGVNADSYILRSGIIIFIAISLHNLPEGLAIGAGGAHSMQLGVMIAMLIAMHDIPEGMAVAAPLIAGGVGRVKTFFIALLSGVSTMIGAFIGIYAGKLSNTADALCLAFASGAMLYVVFEEIIPQSISIRSVAETHGATATHGHDTASMHKSSTGSLPIIIGILAGLVFALL